jgi:uncharacterized coiled-coil protein SlyX
MVEDEYELVQLSPIRKIEKRLEKIERTGTSTEMIKELLDVVRTNQKIVDDMVKVNSEMISKVSELTNSVSSMTSKINDFIGNLEVVGSGENVSEGLSGAEEKITSVDVASKRLDKLEKRLNALILSTMAKSRVRPIQRQPVRM